MKDFIEESAETNLRIIEKNHNWITYHWDENTRFPRNPKDPLHNQTFSVNAPSNNDSVLLLFELNRYEV